jgi:hypothetical protein
MLGQTLVASRMRKLVEGHRRLNLDVEALRKREKAGSRSDLLIRLHTSPACQLGHPGHHVSVGNQDRL